MAKQFSDGERVYYRKWDPPDVVTIVCRDPDNPLRYVIRYDNDVTLHVSHAYLDHITD